MDTTPPERTVTIMIDETGDPKNRSQGKYYIIGATVIDDDKIEEFEDITKSRYTGKELKFRTCPDIRHCIIEEISALNPRIYAITVSKPKSEKWNAEEQRNVHRNALSKLVEYIIRHEKVHRIHIIIDENNRAKSGTVEGIISYISRKSSKIIISKIDRSSNNFRLQTNDFVVGAMGRKYNRAESEYLNSVPRVKRIRKIIRKTNPIKRIS